jgi:hypothetical protein
MRTARFAQNAVGREEGMGMWVIKDWSHDQPLNKGHKYVVVDEKVVMLSVA